jgi:hypothetical protein
MRSVPDTGKGTKGTNEWSRDERGHFTRTRTTWLQTFATNRHMRRRAAVLKRKETLQ